MRLKSAYLLVALLALAVAAQATPLNLTLLTPQYGTGQLNITYTFDNLANTGLLSIQNLAAQSGDYIFPYFSIQAILDATGTLLSGTMDAWDAGSDLLLSGTLTEFGFTDPVDYGPDPLEFVFETTGGSLLPLFEFGGQTVVFTNNITQYGYPGFDASWSFTGGGQNTSPVVPEPATLLLFTTGLGLGLLRLRRARYLSTR